MSCNLFSAVTQLMNHNFVPVPLFNLLTKRKSQRYYLFPCENSSQTFICPLIGRLVIKTLKGNEKTSGKAYNCGILGAVVELVNLLSYPQNSWSVFCADLDSSQAKNLPFLTATPCLRYISCRDTVPEFCLGFRREFSEYKSANQ